MQKTISLALLVLLGACTTGNDAADPHQPNNTIAVVQQPDGRLVALPPACAPWNDELISRHQNDPLPQLGCATAGNMAQMIANPADLVRGELPARSRGTANGGMEAAALERYWAGKDYEPASQSTDGSQASSATAAQ